MTVKTKTTSGQSKVILNLNPLKATSIGDGFHCKPKNKHKRRNWKRYRGQGK